MSKVCRSLILWYCSSTSVWTFTWLHEPETANWRGSDLSSSSSLSFNWSANVVDIKSDNDPESNNTWQGRPLTCTTTTMGFGQTLSEFSTWDKFHSSVCMSWSDDCVASIEEICRAFWNGSSNDSFVSSSKNSSESSNSSSDESPPETVEYLIIRPGLLTWINLSKIFNFSICNQCSKLKYGSGRSE